MTHGRCRGPGFAWLIALALLLALSGPSRAGALDDLDHFLAEVRSGQGSFTQLVTSRSGRRPKHSSGEFAFERPGRFRWSYREPYEQLLVGDGERMWSYDKDLNQVTVKRIGDALGATPAAILSGRSEILRNFALTDAGSAEGLGWVDARPLAADSPFTAMRLGLDGADLKVMRIEDGFGQLTELRFTRFERNPTLDERIFRFVPPPGADVVGE